MAVVLHKIFWNKTFRRPAANHGINKYCGFTIICTANVSIQLHQHLDFTSSNKKHTQKLNIWFVSLNGGTPKTFQNDHF